MKRNEKKNFKQKSFFFEDYNESEIFFGKENLKQIKTSSNRIIFLFLIFLSLIFIFSIKIIYLSLYPEQNTSIIKSPRDLLSERRDIVDRNNVIIARNIHIYSAGIRTKLVKNKKKFLTKLRLIIPDLNANEIKTKLNKEKVNELL